MLDERYMDNLNTYRITSLYETFEPREARRLAERLDIHYTPNNGSWLNMAEIELCVLKGQYLARRISGITTMLASGCMRTKQKQRNEKD